MDCRIFNMRTWPFLCVRRHNIFDSEKLSQIVSCAPNRGSNLRSLDLEYDVLPIEPPHHPIGSRHWLVNLVDFFNSIFWPPSSFWRFWLDTDFLTWHWLFDFTLTCDTNLVIRQWLTGVALTWRPFSDLTLMHLIGSLWRDQSFLLFYCSICLCFRTIHHFIGFFLCSSATNLLFVDST